MESLLSGAGGPFIGRGRGRGRGLRDAFQRGGGSLHHPLHHSLSLGASPSRMGVDLGLGQDELFQGISMDSGLEGLEDDSGSLHEPGWCFVIFMAFATCLSAQPVYGPCAFQLPFGSSVRLSASLSPILFSLSICLHFYSPHHPFALSAHSCVPLTFCLPVFLRFCLLCLQQTRLKLEDKFLLL